MTENLEIHSSLNPNDTHLIEEYIEHFYHCVILYAQTYFNCGLIFNYVKF